MTATTLNTKQKEELLTSYYQLFSPVFSFELFENTEFTPSEQLAVCLAQYKSKTRCNDVSFDIKFDASAVFGFRVLNIKVGDFYNLKNALEELGQSFSSIFKAFNFDDYVSVYRVFSDAYANVSPTHFPMAAFSDFNNKLLFESFSRGLPLNSISDGLEIELSLEDELEASLQNIEAELDVDLESFDSEPSDCLDEPSQYQEDFSEMYSHVSHNPASLKVRPRFSFTDTSVLIEQGEPGVQNLLNNIAWLVYASHCENGTKPNPSSEVVSDDLFLAAVAGTTELIDVISNSLNVKPFLLTFPENIHKLRSRLMEEVEDRTTETISGGVRGGSKDWFSIAEEMCKRKLNLSHNAKAFLSELLEQDDNGIIRLVANIETVLCDSINGNNSSILDFIEMNMRAAEASPLVQSKKIKNALLDKVVGQNDAINQVSESLSSLFTNQGAQHLGVSTFFGVSGTGKTYLAESIASVFSETLHLDYQTIVLNMEQYTHEGDVSKLFGSGSHYVDSGLGDLTLQVAKNPRAIIVFDEIEKAHPIVVQSLLSLIDKGQTVDKTTKRIVDFSLCYFVFTTNIGAKSLTGKNASLNFDPVELLTSRTGSTDAALSPEMANRLASGTIAVFKPMGGKELVKVATKVAAEQGQSFEVRWRQRKLPHLILTTLGADATPRAINSQLEKLSGKVMNCLHETLSDNALQGVQTVNFIIGNVGQNSHPNIQLLTNAPDAMTLNTSDLRVSNFDLNELERVLQSDCDAIVIDGRELTTDYVQVTQLIKQYPSKPVFLGLNERTHTDNPLLLPQYLLQECYEYNEVTSLEWLNRLIRDVKWDTQLILNVDNSLKHHMAVQYNIALDESKTPDNDKGQVGVKITDFVSSQRISKDDAELPFLDFAERPTNTLQEVIGLENIKSKLKVITNTLSGSISGLEKLKAPKGYLFTGQPGTGKTHLAKCLAGECGVSFFAVDAANLLVGNAVHNIKRLFEVAEKYQPSIVFLDEIDSIATCRGKGNSNNDIAVNSLLTAMDGFSQNDNKVFVIAATNHANRLDPALLRPGRFDRQCYFNLPGRAARKQSIQKWFLDKQFELSTSVQDKLLSLSEGETIGAINEMMDNSMLNSVTGGYKWCEKILVEEFKNLKLGSLSIDESQNEETRRRVAYHEAGHMIVHRLLDPESPLEYASIIPRKGALGMVVYGRPKNTTTVTKEHVMSRLQVDLAGIAAETIAGYTGAERSCGGTQDRKVATKLAKQAVVEWGMDSSFGLVIPTELNISDEQLNQTIIKWLEQAYTNVQKLIADNKVLLDKAANALLKYEELDEEQIEALFSEHTARSLAA